MWKIHVSQMSGKLTGIPAINTNPLINRYCNEQSVAEESICHTCYSRYMMTTYRANAIGPFNRNYFALTFCELEEEQIPRFLHHTVRLHAHGELGNAMHLLNFCKIAEMNPRTRFVLWTKRIPIVWECLSEIPENLRLVYSSPRVNVVTDPPRGFERCYSVVTKDHAEKWGIDVVCKPGKDGKTRCKDCMVCYTDNDICRVCEVIRPARPVVGDTSVSASIIHCKSKSRVNRVDET